MMTIKIIKGHYFTIHITPEPSCSYVSFETNAPEKDYASLISKVIGLFKPKEFIVTMFANDVRDSIRYLLNSILNSAF